MLWTITVLGVLAAVGVGGWTYARRGDSRAYSLEEVAQKARIGDRKRNVALLLSVSMNWVGPTERANMILGDIRTDALNMIQNGVYTDAQYESLKGLVFILCLHLPSSDALTSRLEAAL
jgi:hypothetical protein